jgi:two-component system, chemotaxis family, chemotaxis protein CheY
MTEDRGQQASTDDLFAATPAEESTNGPTYSCARCNAVFDGGSELKFCSKYGAPINLDRDSSSRCVLLVDDSKLARRKIGAILKKLGCCVVEAADGKQALKLAVQHKPQMIVLDYQMPVMDGLQTLRALRSEASFAGVPILMLTVEADSAVVRQALAAKANDYIRKDAPVTEILTRLRQHIARLPHKSAGA